jgi:opacity protein-like surface antigen
MKKFALATLLAVMAATAGAVEVGVIGLSDIPTGSKHTTDGGGITIGEHFGKFSLTAEADRQSKINLDRYSLVGGYDLTTVGTATITAKAGVSYLDKNTINQGNRYVGTAGVGLSIPVTGKVSATVDYRYQEGGSNVKAYKGNIVAIGAKYAF